MAYATGFPVWHWMEITQFRAADLQPEVPTYVDQGSHEGHESQHDLNWILKIIENKRLKDLNKQELVALF